MSRIRTIKPSFFLNEELAELSVLTRMLFIGLWTLADCDGRLEDRPKRIRIQVHPYDDGDTDAMLEALHGAGFIVRYEADGKRYIQVKNFKKHQRITGKEAENESLYPPPPEEQEHAGNNGETTGKQRGNNGDFPNAQEGKGREGNGERKGEPRACAREEPTSSLSGSPFPPDFRAPDGWWSWAAQERPDLDIKTELANFVDHYAGKMLVCEPEKVWRKWIRNANTPKPAVQGGGRIQRKEAATTGNVRFGAILSGLKNPVIEGEVVHEIH